MEDLEVKSKLKGFKNLKKYFIYFKYYKFYCFMFWFLLIISAIISFFAPLALGHIISNMTITADFNKAWYYAIVYALLELSNIIVGLINVPFFKNLENKVKKLRFFFFSFRYVFVRSV